MRLRDQLIVIIAVAFATISVAAGVLAQVRAEDRRDENQRVAIAAAWAQPIVPTTTIASGSTTTPPAGQASTPGTEAPGTTESVAEDVSTAPGQNKEDCIPPGQVDRDKPVPPGQDRDMCVPPGQDKDKVTPPGLDKDKVTPPGLDKDKDTPPGQDKDKDKDKDKD